MKLVNILVIKDELERLIRNYRFYSSTEAKYRYEAYKELSEWLGGLEVEDDMDTIHPIEDVVSNDPIANSYKEKYEQALEVAKETYNKQPMYREWLEKMFPELKESEDEKIRKDIKRAISVALDYSYFDKETADNCLSWLEKQGEQKPSDEEMKTLLRTEYEKGRADAIAEIQKRWSEEDELQMQAIIDLLPGLTIRHNWLKSLKDRIQPQPKQEWSEEDEKKRKCLIKGLEDRMGFGWAGDTFSREEYINWLKSLRPQNRWQPSEEQMKALNYVVNLMASSESPKENDYYYNVFNDLRKQLKKLKEEKV